MKINIFVVEDDDALFAALKKGLEAWSFQVTRPDDFESVMRSFLEQQPQLIIMDVTHSRNLTAFIGVARFALFPRYPLFSFPPAITQWIWLWR